MNPELYNEEMDAIASKTCEAEAAMQYPIDRLHVEWLESEELEIYRQLAPRLNFMVPVQLQPFIGAIYKLGYADGMEQAKETIDTWQQPKGPW